VPVPLVLGDAELGEAVEPLEDEPMPPDEEPMLPDEEPVLPEDELEPLAAPCSRRQRSFSEPVRLTHCVLLPLPLTDGELVVPPLVELPVLPPTPCDDDCASAAAENANRAASVAVERVLSIVASPM
jgi:hypothetical protein